MNKQILLVPLILAAAAFAGWKFYNAKSPGVAGAAADHKEEKKGEENETPKVKLTPAALKNANLKIEEAEGAVVKTLLPLYGKIAANEEMMAHVQPRFPGIVKEVHKRLGDRVAKGEILAVVESNESLRTYEVKSEIAGTVTQKDVTLGEFIRDEHTMFVVADLSSVWVDLSVFRRDFALLKQGQAVWIHLGDGEETIESKIAYISPIGTEGTQTMLARCVVPNKNGDLRPGLFVTAEVATGETDAPVTVKLAALQTVKDKTVVFVQDGEVFAAREVELGAKDTERAEILSGVLPGEKYVTENSFILKAELGKGEADND